MAASCHRTSTRRSTACARHRRGRARPPRRADRRARWAPGTTERAAPRAGRRRRRRPEYSPAKPANGCHGTLPTEPGQCPADQVDQCQQTERGHDQTNRTGYRGQQIGRPTGQAGLNQQRHGVFEWPVPIGRRPAWRRRCSGARCRSARRSSVRRLPPAPSRPAPPATPADAALPRSSRTTVATSRAPSGRTSIARPPDQPPTTRWSRWR